MGGHRLSPVESRRERVWLGGLMMVHVKIDKAMGLDEGTLMATL